MAAAKNIVVLTGAGISAESGVPTFRDAQTGFWARYRPEDMASQAGYRANPAMVWRWYEHRREMVARVKPNAGHVALAVFEKRHAAGQFTLVTQNVDGLHQRAGSTDVLCLHGDLNTQRWLDAPKDCCRLDEAVAGDPPRCGRCGNLLRPAVVWFGEALASRVLDRAQQAAEGCDLMLVVGTAGAVYPAAGLARLASRARASVLIVNPAQSELDDAADLIVRSPASVALPRILGTGETRIAA
nr:NAD-dependent deacylase [Diaphorobacter aerolatus]